jgi:hypothetical protein
MQRSDYRFFTGLFFAVILGLSLILNFPIILVPIAVIGLICLVINQVSKRARASNMENGSWLLMQVDQRVISPIVKGLKELLFYFYTIFVCGIGTAVWGFLIHPIVGVLCIILSLIYLGILGSYVSNHKTNFLTRNFVLISVLYPILVLGLVYLRLSK